MDKNEKIIMTVAAMTLFKDKYFQGFSPAKEYNYENVINSNIEWMKRGIAETDFTRKQPIGYCVITNPLKREIFVYQRGGEQNYNENRLSGKFSFGFGGHIEKIDVTGNPIYNSLIRELEEEVQIPWGFDLSILGYINDDENDVGKVHFGMLYLANADTRKIKLNGKEASFGKLMDFSEIENMLQSKNIIIEPWSKIAYYPSIPYIESKKRAMIEEILDKKIKYVKENKEFIDFIRKNAERIELKRVNEEETGGLANIHLTTKAEYEVLFGKTQIGIYVEKRQYGRYGHRDKGNRRWEVESAKGKFLN